MAESNPTRNYTNQEVLELMNCRKSKEEELAKWLEVLSTQNVGMDDPLVDSEDFPSKKSPILQ
jgi:hypothetical protein